MAIIRAIIVISGSNQVKLDVTEEGGVEMCSKTGLFGFFGGLIISDLSWRVQGFREICLGTFMISRFTLGYSH